MQATFSRTLMAAMALAAAPLAQATTALIDTSVSASDQINDSAVQVGANLHDTNGNAMPWVSQVYVGSNECLRLRVTRATFSPHMLAMGVDGSLAFDASSGAKGLPQLVLLPATPGWLTVQVGDVQGEPRVGDFTFSFARYRRASANCADGQPFAPLAEG